MAFLRLSILLITSSNPRDPDNPTQLSMHTETEEKDALCNFLHHLALGQGRPVFENIARGAINKILR